VISIRFSVLGPLAVVRDGVKVPVPGGKIRTLLAALLLRPNQVVSFDQLAERLWGHDLPRHPRRVLQTNVVRLRQFLDLTDVIFTEPHGYLARLEPGQLDLLEFQQLIRTAAGAATLTLEGRLLHDALALWGGPVCADVESDVLDQIDVPPLTEQRLQAIERRVDIDVQLGGSAALVPELRALTTEHPMRERFWAQLMTVLYRTGRQADALEAYRTVSRLLKEEAGIDPSAELRELHQNFLTQQYGLQERSPLPVPRSNDPPAWSRAPGGRPKGVSTAPRAPDTQAASPEKTPEKTPEEAPEVGALIRTWRTRALLTQEQLAQRSGLNVRTIRRLEMHARHRPRTASLSLLAKALKLDETEEAQLIASTRTAGEGVETAPDQSPSSVTVPRQLPLGTAYFIGRDKELSALDATIAEGGWAPQLAPKLVVVVGCAGVGKTALAVHWAHRVMGHFPDGQLYVDLRGFEVSEEPLDPSTVIRGFLHACGVTSQRIPADPDAQSALLRSTLHGKRLLILLDNAREAAQVRHLLPGAGGCLIIVTSRNQLSGLVAAGATPVVLDPLPDADARLMLSQRLGPARADADPRALDEIAALCSGLPLALAMVAARAAIHENFSLEALAAELRVTNDRLDALSGDDGFADARTVFSWSYRTLSVEAARLFRLLGVHPAQDIGVPAAASLAGLPIRRTRRLLGELRAAHLVFEPAPGRYLQHDLVRAYAAELVASQELSSGRPDLENRVVSHYVHTGLAASRHLTSLPQSAVQVDPLPEGVHPQPITGCEEAMDWFRDEHKTLLTLVTQAIDNGHDNLVGQIAGVLADYFDRSGHWQDWAITERSALEAARRTGDIAVQARALHMLARATAKLGGHEEACALCLPAIRLYHRLGDRLSEATVHRTFTCPASRLGKYNEALEHGWRALELYRVVGHEEGVGSSLNAVGWAYAKLDDPERALIYCTEALQRLRRTDERRQQAATWDSLGYIHVMLAHVDEAARCYLRSADLYRELGDDYGSAVALSRLGDVYRDDDNPGAAAKVWRQALATLQELEHPDTGEVRNKLRSLPSPRLPGRFLVREGSGAIGSPDICGS
jgi:DNA-binding SARP family transcriptional activator/tetratricopeptide (TPR) repeat protein/transcriptional regulator with XRE-family HTH domain